MMSIRQGEKEILRMGSFSTLFDSFLDSNLLCEKKGDLWLDQNELIYPFSITLSPESIQGIRLIRVESGLVRPINLTS